MVDIATGSGEGSGKSSNDSFFEQDYKRRRNEMEKAKFAMANNGEMPTENTDIFDVPKYIRGENIGGPISSPKFEMNEQDIETDKWLNGTDFEQKTEDFYFSKDMTPEQFIESLVPVTEKATNDAEGKFASIGADFKASYTDKENYILKNFGVPTGRYFERIVGNIINLKKSVESVLSDNIEFIDSTSDIFDDEQTEQPETTPQLEYVDSVSSMFDSVKEKNIGNGGTSDKKYENSEGREFLPACIYQMFENYGLECSNKVIRIRSKKNPDADPYHVFRLTGDKNGKSYDALVCVNPKYGLGTYYFDLTNESESIAELKKEYDKHFVDSKKSLISYVDKKYTENRNYLKADGESETNAFVSIISALENTTGVDPSQALNYLGISRKQYDSIRNKNKAWLPKDSVSSQPEKIGDMAVQSLKELEKYKQADTNSEELKKRVESISAISDPEQAAREAIILLNEGYGDNKQIGLEIGVLALKNALKTATGIMVFLPPEGSNDFASISHVAVFNELRRLGLNDGVKLPMGTFAQLHLTNLDKESA